MPFAETFTLHTRTVTGQDSLGNDVYESSDLTIRGAFAPSGSTELVQGQMTVITHDTLYLEDGTPVPNPSDTITVRGTVRQIDGKPWDYLSPLTGRHPGAVVRLIDVEG